MLRDTLAARLRPVVEGSGCELWELEYAPRGSGGLLRLYIDTAAGVTLEDCERVSRAVGEVLDAEDLVPGRYTLEVSSPGLDRPLREAAHFARCLGATALVELAKPLDGRRRFKGRLEAVTPDGVAMTVDGRRCVLPLDGIRKARLAPEY